MSKIKIVLVDDEKDALRLLESLLEKLDYIKVVGTASNKSEALTKVIELKPDVIFQDIQMNGLNGMELVDDYRRYHYKGKIVFVTAYAEYAIDAIKKMAYDYLLKPVDVDELNSLALRLLADQNALNEDIFAQNRKLKIPTRQGYTLISINDIVYCEADGNYTSITSVNSDMATTSLNLGRIEKEISDHKFFRVNRSVLVNTDFLTSLNKGEKKCILKNSNKEYIFHISAKRIKALEYLL